MSKRKSDDDDNSPLGCLALIILVIVGWGLVFGVSVNGKHYGLAGCSCERGVEIDR